jgi:hypothetical protein
MTAAITTAARTASGSSSNKPVRKRSVTAVEHRDHERRKLALRPTAGVHRGLREAAVHDHAARKARAEVGGTHAEQFAVRVDLVVVSRRVGLGRAEPFRETDQHRAQSRRDEVEIVREADVGKPE